MFHNILNALKQNNKIERLSFAKNEMNRMICSSTLKLTRSQNQMVRLCLAHCEITDEGMSIINNGLENTNIRYLNISWNNLTPVSMESLANFVSSNQYLEKLLIQHNEFGSSELKDLGKALAKHKSVKYLDVSANGIQAEGFITLMQMIASSEIPLHTFQCRKNEIDGTKVHNGLFEKLHQSTYLHVLNLRGNQFLNDTALEMTKYCEQNVYIEEIGLSGNNKIHSPEIEEIEN